MSQQASPPFYSDSDYTNANYAFNSKVLIAAIIVLFCVIFVILLLHIYANWVWRRSSRSIFIRRGIASSFRSAVRSAVNTGLDAAFIAQLPTFIYKAPSVENLEAGKAESMVPLLECAVCLSEFQENEKGRMLPSCKHAFHTECIDMWFFSHSTCPLCRAVVSPGTETSLASDEQHQGEGQEAMGASHANHVAPTAVQFPCNVLFWGNEVQVASTQEPSSLTSSPPAPSRTRVMPQITIDIPPIEGGVVLRITTPGRRSSKSTSCCDRDEAACSSHETLSSPGFCASLKRMLSRQSSRRSPKL